MTPKKDYNKVALNQIADKMSKLESTNDMLKQALTQIARANYHIRASEELRDYTWKTAFSAIKAASFEGLAPVTDIEQILKIS